jgi:Domain of unknown function (DUF4157)
MRQFSKQNQSAKTGSAQLASPRRVTPKRTRAPEHGPSRTPALPAGFDFSRIPVHGKTPVGIQTKLTIGLPGDALEHEADRVADQVMRAPPERATFPAFAHLSGSGVLQRKCACGGEAGLSGQCTECGGREGKLQRHATGTGGTTTAPPIVHDVLRSAGQPLDGVTRALMEPRFGHDFGRVRVHVDAMAAESASALNALAYTVGHDIVFGGGQFAPSTGKGKSLLAHELTHVTQQGETGIPSQLMIGPSGDMHEREAEMVARDTSYMPLSQDAVTEGRLQRAPAEGTMASAEMQTRSVSPCVDNQPTCSVCLLPQGGVKWMRSGGPYVYITSKGSAASCASEDIGLKEVRKDRDCPQYDNRADRRRDSLTRVRLGLPP